MSAHCTTAVLRSTNRKGVARGRRSSRLLSARKSDCEADALLLFLLETLVTLALLPGARATLDLFRSVKQVAPAESLDAGPFVSILVPARNEERVIERCVRSLLDQQYPNFEVIVLNDRSTDRTGQILDDLAARDRRLRVLVGESLPDGWVGKCWAAQQAARAAQGEWLLFVDADTRHQPAMLASSMRFAEEHGADLLSLGPHQEMVTFWERALLPAIFGIILTSGGSVGDVNDPRKPLAKANGQFMLFRAEVYRRLGGHEAVKDEIVDDFAFARRVKGTGHRLLLAGGADLAATRMYRSLAEIWQGFSKNSYAEARRQPGGAALGVLLPWLVIGTPAAVLARLSTGVLRRRRLGVLDWAMLLQALAQCGVLAAFSLQITRLLRLPLRWALVVPMGLLFFSFVLLNSTVRVLSGRGVTWKGRSYDPAGRASAGAGPRR